jgi:spore coat-associated protein N
MQLSLTSTGGKVLASTVLIGAAASVAGLGTFGTFTSTTAASATVASGTASRR